MQIPAVAPGTKTYASNPDFDANALARVSGWIEDERAMFVKAGLAEAADLDSVRVDFVPFSPAAQMNAATGTLLLGTIGKRDVPVTRSDDLVRHEYAHYVLERTLLPHIVSSPEAAAMHESLADTFASVLDVDWTLGEGMLSDGRVYRSMEDPHQGAVPLSYTVKQLPATMSEIPANFPPHGRAGIPNHAAYLIGTALGRDRLASLYVDALRALDRGLGFTAFADATVAVAAPTERTAVVDAWKAVGITTGS